MCFVALLVTGKQQNATTRRICHDTAMTVVATGEYRSSGNSVQKRPIYLSAHALFASFGPKVALILVSKFHKRPELRNVDRK